MPSLRDRQAAGPVAAAGGCAKYLDLIAVDDGSASQMVKSSSGLDQWVPEEQWTPGFQWLQESVVKEAPYVKVQLYRPNSLDSAPEQWRSGFFLSQIESRRGGAASRPVMFLAYGKRAELVRRAILANDQRPQSSQVFDATQSSVLVLRSQDPTSGTGRITLDNEKPYKDLLRSYNELSEGRPGVRLRNENGAQDKSQQRTTILTSKEYNSILEKLREQRLKFIPYLLLNASRGGDAKAIETLIQERPNVLAAMKAEYDTTPLIIASELGHYNVVQLLLRERVAVDDANQAGITALQVAAASGWLEVVDLLLINRADVNKADEEGRTPLIVAASAGQRSVLELLLQHGANINAQTTMGDTALLLATEGGYVRTVETLVKHFANTDLANTNGWTSLMIAASKRNSSIVHILLEGGADFKKTNDQGKAAFSLATSESVLYLLRGAMLQEICRESELTEESYSLVEQLLAQGADINQKGRDGKSALEQAISRQNPRLQTLLENPPLSNGPSSYTSGRSFEILKPPLSVNRQYESSFRCEVVDFHILDGKERRFRCRTPPTVYELIYSNGPTTMNSLMSNKVVKGSDASFRWIHLPACNLSWVKDLMTRIALEKHPNLHEVNAHDLDEVISKLLTRDDGRRKRGSVLNPNARPRHLKPQATLVRRPPNAKSLIRDSVFMFMPYLHYESHAQYNALDEDSATPVAPLDNGNFEAPDYPQDFPVHPRRTLDQFYYEPLDTKKRDSDQVVYRYMKNILKTEDPQLFMVDQLWLWILDSGKTVVSCFPRQSEIKDEDRDNPLHDVQRTDVLSSILRKLDSPDRPEICSPYELAVLICTHCFGTFFDPARAIGEELHFIHFFERSIGNLSNEETIRFQELKDFLEEIENVMALFEKLEENPDWEEQLDILNRFGDSVIHAAGLTLSSFYEILKSQDVQQSDSKVRTKYEEYFFKRSYALLDISREVQLMHEIKDIRDELSIIKLIFDDQILAVKSMLDLIDSGDLNNESYPAGNPGTRPRAPSGRHSPLPDRSALIAVADRAEPSKTSTTVYSFKNFLSTLKRQHELIDKMDDRASRIYQDIEQLLDLKQKQASVFEAHFSGRLAEKQRQLLDQAREQTDKAGRQGNVVMVFTVVTVIFLPASFMAAFFALQIEQFPQAPSGNGLALPLDYVTGWIVGITAICVSIIGIIGFNINRLTDSIAGSRFARWYGKVEKSASKWLRATGRSIMYAIKLPWLLLGLPIDIWLARRRRQGERKIQTIAAEGEESGLDSSASKPSG